MRIRDEVASFSAEELDITSDSEARSLRAIGSRCTICNRNLTAYEVKFVLPSKSYGEIRLPLGKRLACVDCYSKISSRRFVKTRTKTRTLKRIRRIAYRPKNEIFARN